MSASCWWQSRKLMFLPDTIKKEKKEERLCKIKTEAFYLQECWWTWNEGRSPALKLNAPDALQTKWWKLEFCSLRIFPSAVSLSNLIFPMNDTFRISDGTTKQQQQQHSESTSGRHTTATATPPRPNPSPEGEKKEKRQIWNPFPQSKCRRWRKVVGI